MTDDWAAPSSRAEQLEQGRRVRRERPRSELARQAGGGRDPLGILEAQNATRVPDLVPLRRERMAASPFAFFRGTAALMAADLADAPHSGILVASCGDAHVSNFGFYASPERSLVFDLNDFDEAAGAPWEWDVKRLVTSIVIGGRAARRSEAATEEAARAAITAYVRGLRRATKLSPTDRYFAHFTVSASMAVLDDASRKAVRRSVKQAERRTGERAVRRLTTADSGGRLRFVPDPPAMSPVADDTRRLVDGLVHDFRRTTSPDVTQLFEHYRVADIVRRVVGVGSVGTRCYLVLLQDGDGNSLLMQSKEAGRSVLAEYGSIPQPDALRERVETFGEGSRVVTMQKILQGLSDPFLGHLRSEGTDYYVRQFHDMKGGIETEELDDAPFAAYAQACAATLARAHSQSVAATRAIGYIGDGGRVAESLLTWSYDYAEVSLADYEAFRAAAP
ncbi:DUF2252 domain-containing protein [Microbacterium sp. KUDC0406]|uniref:DUF2252 domain-containing protein n=1 Tax=Microbacterium sp. KUDC0406 TaxID=2909588 RepID=UPI001F2055E3|nr:DUF2252 family protein [Microbacterium sp. KUDC0406]UJP09758.1 DUF2252 domain-containing protein [Microbacterium sp. KUDC0406]